MSALVDPLEPMMASVLAGARRWWVEHSSMLFALRCLPDASIDSCVCDPPYELGFMGRLWDSSGIAFRKETWAEVFRVLKPGGYLLAFGGSRTAHRIACAIEDAGFEIRDSLEWLYGSGFPKSLNVSKAIDKAAGAEREVTPVAPMKAKGEVGSISKNLRCVACGKARQCQDPCTCPRDSGPATDAAKQWDGWGTALKPSHEPIIVARKPFPGTVAGNVLEHGTGAINIDACRVAHASAEDLAGHEAQVAAIKARGGQMADSWKNSSDLSGANDVNSAGRWPPNTLLTHSAACRVVGARAVKANPTWATPNRECESTFTGAVVSEVRHTDETVLEYECAADCPVREMDGQSGELKSGALTGFVGTKLGYNGGGSGFEANVQASTGTASRFFPQSQWLPELDDVAPFRYAAKAARAERDRGLESFPGRAAQRDTPNPGGVDEGAKNTHPTVKPVELLRWLVRLVTQPKGVVLDPFAGSGSCGIASMLEGFRYIGIELNDTEAEPFVSIARARIAHVIGGGYVPANQQTPEPVRRVEPAQQSLFARVGS